MRCRLEKNNYLHEVFRIMEKALETHDFSEFLSYVSENCVFEVQTYARRKTIKIMKRLRLR